MNSIKRTATAAGVLVALALLAGLVGCGRQGRSGEPTRVTVYMYSEYIDPQLIPKFESASGFRLRIDVYENSEEMLAKMSQAGGDSQYDVVVASDVVVPALVKLGLVQPLDKALIPNAANVLDDFADPPFDPGCRYSLPYQWGTVGLMYRRNLIEGDVSWAHIFDSARQPGPFVLMDSMRDMLGIGLKFLGHSMNTVDPARVKAAGDLLLAAKKSPRCLGFEGGVGGKNKVLAGQAALAVVYNGDAVRAIDETADQAGTSPFVYAVPREGGVIWVDVMLASARAPNPAGGHAFMNFILDAENGAALSTFNRYATPNRDSLPLISEADRANPGIYPPAELHDRLEYLVDLGPDTRLYDEVWTMVKAR